MRIHNPAITGSLTLSGSNLTVTNDGTVSGSSTSTGSFGHGFIANNLHVKTSAASGHEAPSANANNLIIEENGNAGISIITPNSSQGSIYFGDNANTAGRIFYDHSTDRLRFSANASGFVDIVSGGHISGSSTSTGSFGSAHIADKVGIGTTSPTR